VIVTSCGRSRTIRRAAVDVSGEPFADLAAEVQMTFMCD
jgi:hypothetical protein